MTEHKPNPINAALRECRSPFLAALWFSLFINLLMLAVPIFSLQVLDRVLSSGSVETLLMLMIVAAICLLFMGLLQGLRTLTFAHIGRWMDDRLSTVIVRTTAELAIHKPNIGSQPMRDLGAIRGFITSPALASIFDAPWAVIYFAVIYMINVQLGITVTLGAVLMLCLAIAAHIFPSQKVAASNDRNVKALQAFDAMLRNAEAIKAMGFLSNASRAWHRSNQEGLSLSFSASNITTVLSTTTRTLRMGLQVLLMGFGGYLAISGVMSPGGIIAVSILAGRALAPFDAAIPVFQGLVGVKRSYRRLSEMAASIRLPGDLISLPPPRGAVAFDKIAYQEPVRNRWILRGINIDIAPGETVGLIGPSGAGKTTLARLLVGVIPPTSGSVRLDGAALDQWDNRQLGSLIGYLPQDVELFEGTVAANIARLDEEASDEAIVAAARLAEVHETILQLPNGYQTEIGQNGMALSAGQRQRIGLARCFFGEPKLVVLDEPNANLDSEGEQAFIQCLRNAKAQEITTVVIAHRSSVLREAEKILVLVGGEAKMYGPAKEIIEKLSLSSSNVEPIRKAAV